MSIRSMFAVLLVVRVSLERTLEFTWGSREPPKDLMVGIMPDSLRLCSRPRWHD
jgi:hypothetical protein